MFYPRLLFFKKLEKKEEILTEKMKRSPDERSTHKHMEA
jgi:hypothetical protein